MIKKLYTTLGPSFYFRNEMAVTRRRKILFQFWAMIWKALAEISRLSMSKRDLECFKNQKNTIFCRRRPNARRTTIRSTKRRRMMFKWFFIWLYMMKYDRYHRKMMFEVICIINKLRKHWKNIEIWRKTCRKVRNSKNAAIFFWSILSYAKFSADSEFDIDFF